MKQLLAIIALVALMLGVTGSAIAADEGLPHTGRVLIVAGGDVNIGFDEQADVVIVIGGDARIAGTVNTLVIVDGTATVTGATLETIAIVNGTAELARGTTINGDVHHLNSTIDRGDAVQVGGAIKDLTGSFATFGLFLGAAMVVLWIGFGIATLLFALLLVGLAARQVRTATSLIGREPGRTALVGVLAVFVTPLLAFLAMATLIGIPTGVGLLVVVWPAVAFVGYVVAAIWLGEWLLYRGRSGERPERPYAPALLGLVVAFVVGLVPLVTAILSIFGLGAVVLAGWRTLRGEGAPRPVLQTHQAPAA